MKKETPNFVTIVALTVVTLFFWVTFSIYQAVIDDADIDIEESVLLDIEPVIDSQTLATLDAKGFIEEPELSSLVGSVESSVQVVNQNNEQGEDLATPQATQAATLEEDLLDLAPESDNTDVDE